MRELPQKTIFAKDKPLDIDLDIGRLMLYCALVENGTCPAAARHLGLNSHIPVGKARRVIEEKYGVQLFDLSVRYKNGSPTTAAGDEMYERAKKIIAAYRNMEKSMRGYAKGLPRKQKVGLAMEPWLHGDMGPWWDNPENAIYKQLGTSFEFHHDLAIGREEAARCMQGKKYGVYLSLSDKLDIPKCLPPQEIEAFSEVWFAWQLEAQYRDKAGTGLTHIRWSKSLDCQWNILNHVGMHPWPQRWAKTEYSYAWEIKSALESAGGLAFLPKRLKPVDSVLVNEIYPINVKVFAYVRQDLG